MFHKRAQCRAGRRHCSERDQAKAGAGTGTVGGGEGGGGARAAAGTVAAAGNVAEAVRGHNLLHSVVILRRCWMSCMTHTHTHILHTHTHACEPFLPILENFAVWHSLNIVK